MFFGNTSPPRTVLHLNTMYAGSFRPSAVQHSIMIISCFSYTSVRTFTSLIPLLLTVMPQAYIKEHGRLVSANLTRRVALFKPLLGKVALECDQVLIEVARHPLARGSSVYQVKSKTLHEPCHPACLFWTKFMQHLTHWLALLCLLE